MDVNKALETQLKNIEMRTGKTLAELACIAEKCGLTKHGEIRDYLKRELGMGHGDANTFVHHLKQASQPEAKAKSGGGDVLDEIYTGAKAALRPIHEKLMSEITKFGEFEIAPHRRRAMSA